jgi:hypothetical protein
MSEQLRKVDHPMIDGFTEEFLEVYAGEDGAGGVPHHYLVFRKDDVDGMSPICEIKLQHGHPKEVGINGIGNQTLLLILQDFIRKANAGEFACRENSVSITKIEEALQWNKQRELDRKKRGVLQTYKK